MKTFGGALGAILDDVKRRIADEYSEVEIALKKGGNHDKISLCQAILDEDGVSVIAEIKPRSPSKGTLRMVSNAGDFGRQFVEAGAVGISVLIEPVHFGGSISALRSVRAAVQAPILAKDFFIDEKQVILASQAEADVILLIAKLHTARSLERLISLSRTYRMEALVEIHDEEDLLNAVEVDARLIGINNRDLVTLQTNLETTEKLAPLVRESFGSKVVLVSESGISSGRDVIRLKKHDIDAVLVGSAIMQANSPKDKVRELREAGKE